MTILWTGRVDDAVDGGRGLRLAVRWRRGLLQRRRDLVPLYIHGAQRMPAAFVGSGKLASLKCPMVTRFTGMPKHDGC